MFYNESCSKCSESSHLSKVDLCEQSRWIRIVGQVRNFTSGMYISVQLHDLETS